MSIAATGATIDAILASAHGGEVISLKGECARITIDRAYPKRVTINAGRSTVAGLFITGSNVRWRGGTLRAAGGAYGVAQAGYAAQVHRGASHIRLDSVLVTAAKKGVVVDEASDIAIKRSRFWRLGEDGIIASRTAGLTIADNHFSETQGKPTQCVTGGVTTYGVAKRDCKGVWTDGTHPDAIQMRDGVTDAQIYGNLVEGNTQGITQMDTPGDAPLERVHVYDNVVRTDNYHHITLTRCAECSIRNNRVERAAGSQKKAVIRAGEALRCGNYAQDEKMQDGACP